MNAKNISGSKPIHIAARDGHLDIVKFYLEKKIKLNDLGNLGQSLLHYAVQGGQLEIVKYLISQNMDVNLSDENQAKPLHLAAQNGYREIIYTLLDNGAYFDATTIRNTTALEIAQSHKQEEVRKLLEITAKLFHAVKHNNILETERYLKEVAVVNVKIQDNVTPLHYASWKGYEDIVNILLNYKANPNVTGKSGCTPLHYACKYNHFNIVKSLLSHKAAYNASCSNRKTAMDFATCPNIKKLLRLISESFQSVQNGNTEVISRLNRIKDKDILKIVMNTYNKDNKTLVTVAIHYDFPKVKQLKQVLQDDMCTEKRIAEALCSQERYEEALKLYKSVFEKRKDLLGLEHPDTLDMQLMVGRMLYQQQKYMEALKVSEEVYKTQREVLGEGNADTLRTNGQIALILHRLSKNEEALALYKSFLPKFIDILGPNHSDVLDTQCEMALVLCALFKYEEALKVNHDIFKIRKKISGPNNTKTLVLQNNIAMVLAYQGKDKEALELYKKVYEARKKVLGPNHSDTLRTSHWIARLTCCMKQNDDADVLKEVIERQENALGPDHFDTLNTQYTHANYLFSKGRIEESLKIYQNIIGRYKDILGDSHTSVVDIERKITTIKKAMTMAGRSESSDFPQQNDTHNAPDFFDLMHTFAKQKKINIQDENSLTPLHYAASKGNEQLVKQLLQQGANVMLKSNKGNTALHIAASKGFDRIVDILLEHVKNYNLPNLDDFVNAQTTNGKTSALHVAGNKNVAISLLTYGAIYNIKNKNGEAPIQVSKHTDIVYLLSIIEEIFTCCENGSQNLLEIMTKLKPDEIKAATNAHNLDGETMLNKAANQPHIARQIKKLQRSH
ncbi:hypothetical protein JTE90_024104 [Oedothorax gibbosus]|uniref:Uncharacterized protein n=1 Tax=Oedothorax gibbosus TaxID=931172 RepID=A0AAV6USQ1_9ARAC|nr:hypothetical protein JTE90_024104 [Oedothorax gibbosus]